MCHVDIGASLDWADRHADDGETFTVFAIVGGSVKLRGWNPDRARVYENADGDWRVECLVCNAWVSTSNATRRDAEQKIGRHVQNDHEADRGNT